MIGISRRRVTLLTFSYSILNRPVTIYKHILKNTSTLQFSPTTV